MEKKMNNINLIGRLTKNVELSTTQTGKTKASFTLAVERRYAKDGQNADFINCESWENTAKFMAQYMHKGDRIGLTGRLAVDQYRDNQGNNKTFTKVVVEEVYFADGKKGGSKKEEAGIDFIDSAFNIDNIDFNQMSGLNKPVHLYKNTKEKDKNMDKENQMVLKEIYQKRIIKTYILDNQKTINKGVNGIFEMLQSYKNRYINALAEMKKAEKDKYLIKRKKLLKQNLRLREKNKKYKLQIDEFNIEKEKEIKKIEEEHIQEIEKLHQEINEIKIKMKTYQKIAENKKDIKEIIDGLRHVQV